MKLYTYKAKVKGQDIETDSIVKLAKEINEIFEFEVVTRDTLHNYFTRPHLMKLKLKRLQSLGIERSIVSFPEIPE